MAGIGHKDFRALKTQALAGGQKMIKNARRIKMIERFPLNLILGMVCVMGYSFDARAEVAVPTFSVDPLGIFEDGSARSVVVIDPPVNPGASQTLTIEGIPGEYLVDLAGGNYNPANDTWTIVVPPGAGYASGPVLAPPLGSDADLSGLIVKVSTFDPNTGQRNSATQELDITIDAVANTPFLSVSGGRQGLADETFSLTIDTAVTDLDGSENISTVFVSSVPDAFTFSAGTNRGNGLYEFSLPELENLTFTALDHFDSTVTLDIESIAGEVNLTDDETTLDNNFASAFGEAVFVITAVPEPTTAATLLFCTGAALCRRRSISYSIP